MENLFEQQKAIDTLAKEMRPTRNGPITARHFMEAVETMFTHRGWNLSEYIHVATLAHNARLASTAHKTNKVELMDTQLP